MTIVARCDPACQHRHTVMSGIGEHGLLNPACCTGTGIAGTGTPLPAIHATAAG